jgi:hypothetical protein
VKYRVLYRRPATIRTRRDLELASWGRTAKKLSKPPARKDHVPVSPSSCATARQAE